MTIADKASKNSLGSLLLGLFLILWSVNGYFIGGNAFKYLILFGGLSLVFYININRSLAKTRNWFNFLVFVFLIGLSYYIKAIIQTQEVTTLVLTIFGFINLLLLTTGYLIGQNWAKFKNISIRQVYIIIFLTIIGGSFFFVFQNALYSESAEVSRSVAGDEEGGVNVIGIAYTNALIVIIIFNIIRHLPQMKKFQFYLLVICMFLSSFVIMQTQSRGALIYLILIIIISSIYNFKAINLILYLKKFIVYLIVFIVAIIILVKVSPSAELAFEGLFKRLENLFNFFGGTNIDNSALARENMYEAFFNNYHEYLFFGQRGYVPYPHNIFIETIQRFGLILGIPFFFILLLSVFTSFRHLLGKNRILVLDIFCMIFLFSFFQSLSSMSLEMNRSLWLSMGVVLGCIRKYT